MSTSVTSVVNHFPSAQNGFTTTLASTVSGGATTVPLNSVAGYSNGEIAVMVVDPGDANKKQTFTGVVDTAGVQLTSVVWTAGTNRTHTGGSTVVDYATATHISMISKGLKISFDQDGTLKAGAVDNAAVVADGILTAAKSTTGTNVETRGSETIADHVASGCVWSGDAYASTRNASCTSGVVYLSGKRLTVAAVTARSFTASKDAYCDLHDNGDGTAVWVYSESSNNAASQALTAGNHRGAIIVTGASNIANVGSINQGQTNKVLPIASSVPYAVTDSIGNLICNRNSNLGVIGYREITSIFVTNTSGSFVDITGLTFTCIVPDNKRLQLKVYSVNIGQGGTTTFELAIFEGATRLQSSFANSTAAIPNVFLSPEVVLNPTSGAHTYKAAIQASAGVGNSVNGSSTSPAYIQARIV